MHMSVCVMQRHKEHNSAGITYDFRGEVSVSVLQYLLFMLSMLLQLALTHHVDQPIETSHLPLLWKVHNLHVLCGLSSYMAGW